MDRAQSSRPVAVTRAHRWLAGLVVAGAVVIAGIGFAGSYAAVRDLALRKGFGWFANVFPVGIDAGIVVLLALDLLLTWIRIPFPLLRQTAWLLTAATIAFNGAAAWPDPLGVGMHAVIPVLFVVSVEAARHAVGRIADITADRHMESVRIARWLLAFPSTFRLWRRMKLWELRSYDEVIRLEQERLVYQARLRAKYGRAWRRKAPVESVMPLRLARYGVPLTQSAHVGLAAAGIPLPQSTAADETPPAAAPRPTREPATQPDSQPEFVPQAAAEPEFGPAFEQEFLAEPEPEPGPEPVREQIEQTRPFAVLPSQSRDAADGDPEPIPAAQTPSAEPVPEEAAANSSKATPASHGGSRFDMIYTAFAARTDDLGHYPTLEDLSKVLHAQYDVTGRGGRPLSPDSLRRYVTQLRGRYESEHRAGVSLDS